MASAITRTGTLQLRENVALEIHAIQRSVIAPRHDGLALLGG
jgi:hypothetical protein